MAAGEADARGRKKSRANPAVEGDEEMAGDKKEKKARSQTPAQRSISTKKTIREKSAGRREGAFPARLPYKLVPEE